MDTKDGQDAQDGRVLEMWTVYRYPRSHPEDYVARKWRVTDGHIEPTGMVIVDPSLEAIREILVMTGLRCLARSDDEDPVVVETWV